MAAGFVFHFTIGWYAGLPFLLIGVFGAVVSGIVRVALPKSARPIQPPVGWPTGAAPGWYPDPQNGSMLRYFDGRMWTLSTQPCQ
ncbi:MAG: hypothetical protein QOH91_1264 [Mycobacterium sp.]|nr:hypothetical protein [Mycobacterium sp.]